MIDRAQEHLGDERAGRYLRKFYPWYMEPLGASPELADELQRHADLARARHLIADLAAPVSRGSKIGFGRAKRLAIIPRLPALVW